MTTTYRFTSRHYIRPPAERGRKCRLQYVYAANESTVNTVHNDGLITRQARADLVGWTIEPPPVFQVGDIVYLVDGGLRHALRNADDVARTKTHAALLIERPRAKRPPAPCRFQEGDYVRYKKTWVGRVLSDSGHGRPLVEVVDPCGHDDFPRGNRMSCAIESLRRLSRKYQLPRPPRQSNALQPGTHVKCFRIGGAADPTFVVESSYGDSVKLRHPNGRFFWVGVSHCQPMPLGSDDAPIPFAPSDAAKRIAELEVQLAERKEALHREQGVHVQLRRELEEWRTGQRIKTGHGTSGISREWCAAETRKLGIPTGYPMPDGLRAAFLSQWPELTSMRAATVDATSNVGRKDDGGKPRYDLIPPGALADVARVLAHGAAKYGDANWRRVEGAKGRYYAAAMRHLEAWREGPRSGHSTLDADSGLPHLAHALCCILFLSELDRTPKSG